MAQRKVHFQDLQLPVSYDTSPAKQPLYLQRAKRRVQTTSLLRLVCTLLLVILALIFVRRRFFPDNKPQNVTTARNTVLGNCKSLETLRRARECHEFVSSERTYQRLHHVVGSQPRQSRFHDDRGLRSSFGAVLDYDAAYDTFTGVSAGEERYNTKRALKCLIGYSMSVVWDFEIQTTLTHAYKSGLYGFNTHTGTHKDGQAASICPNNQTESSAAMSLSINCGFDVKRDPWGNPATDTDHEELETCTRIAYAWIKGKDMADVEPWANLCHEDDTKADQYSCNRHVFQLESNR